MVIFPFLVKLQSYPALAYCRSIKVTRFYGHELIGLTIVREFRSIYSQISDLFASFEKDRIPIHYVLHTVIRWMSKAQGH